MRVCIYGDNTERWHSLEAHCAYIGFKKLGWDVVVGMQEPAADDALYFGPRHWMLTALRAQQRDVRTLGRFPHTLRQFLDKAPRSMTITKFRDFCQAGSFDSFRVLSDSDPAHFHERFVASVGDVLDIFDMPASDVVHVMPDIKYLSEYRCYADKGAIVGVTHVAGSPLLFPSSDVLRKLQKQLKNVVASALVIDVGIAEFQERPEKIRNPTLLKSCFEVFDVSCVGVSPVVYATMLQHRWYDFKRRA